MNPIYNYIFVSLAITSICFIVASWHFRKKFSEHDVDVMTGVATIITGIVSIIVGYVSVNVMQNQDNMQKMLVEFQEKEHQPIFVLKHHYDEEFSYYQEFSIENSGHTYKYLEDVTDKTFIKVTHNIDGDESKEIVSYIPLSNFYFMSRKTGDVKDLIYYSYGANRVRNSEIVQNMRKEAVLYNQQHDNEYIYVEEVLFFIIKYTDIYDKEKTVYMKDKEIVTEEIYNNIVTLAEQDYGLRTYDLSKVNLNIYLNDRKKNN